MRERFADGGLFEAARELPELVDESWANLKKSHVTLSDLMARCATEVRNGLITPTQESAAEFAQITILWLNLRGLSQDEVPEAMSSTLAAFNPIAVGGAIRKRGLFSSAQVHEIESTAKLIYDEVWTAEQDAHEGMFDLSSFMKEFSTNNVVKALEEVHAEQARMRQLRQWIVAEHEKNKHLPDDTPAATQTKLTIKYYENQIRASKAEIDEMSEQIHVGLADLDVAEFTAEADVEVDLPRPPTGLGLEGFDFEDLPDAAEVEKAQDEEDAKEAMAFAAEIDITLVGYEESDIVFLDDDRRLSIGNIDELLIALGVPPATEDAEGRIGGDGVEDATAVALEEKRAEEHEASADIDEMDDIVDVVIPSDLPEGHPLAAEGLEGYTIQGLQWTSDEDGFIAFKSVISAAHLIHELQVGKASGYIGVIVRVFNEPLRAELHVPKRMGSVVFTADAERTLPSDKFHEIEQKLTVAAITVGGVEYRMNSWTSAGTIRSMLETINGNDHVQARFTLRNYHAAANLYAVAKWDVFFTALYTNNPDAFETEIRVKILEPLAFGPKKHQTEYHLTSKLFNVTPGVDACDGKLKEELREFFPGLADVTVPVPASTAAVAAVVAKPLNGLKPTTKGDPAITVVVAVHSVSEETFGEAVGKFLKKEEEDIKAGAKERIESLMKKDRHELLDKGVAVWGIIDGTFGVVSSFTFEGADKGGHVFLTAALTACGAGAMASPLAIGILGAVVIYKIWRLRKFLSI